MPLVTEMMLRSETDWDEFLAIAESARDINGNKETSMHDIVLLSGIPDSFPCMVQLTEVALTNHLAYTVSVVTMSDARRVLIEAGELEPVST